MSVHYMAKVWDTEFPNATRKLVALALADHASAEGICWPSIRTIGQMCGISETQVREHIAGLQEAGILEKKARTTDTGRQTSNLFRILENGLAAYPTAGRTLPASPTPTLGQAAPSPCGTPHPPPYGQPHPLNHHKEPSGEPSKKTIGGGGVDLFQGEPPEPDFPAGSMMKSWNLLVPSLAKITGIVGPRATHARAVYKKLGGSMADWDAFCKRIEAADKLTGRFKGRSTSNWKADFDWCMKPGSFLKITEGKYDPQPTPTNEKRFW